MFYRRLRIHTVAVFLAVLCLLFSAPAGAADAPAAEIRNSVTVSVSGGQFGGMLRDGYRYTHLVLSAGVEITITSETAFSAIYLIWDRPPAAWILETDSLPPAEIDSGFMHEAVTMQTAVNEAVISLGRSEYILCEIYLFTEGRLPAWVQLWQPSLDLADLLLLPAQAGDEHLFFGGILPLYAGERGLNVQVAYMTAHQNERERPHELLDGLWEVGVTAYPLFGPFENTDSTQESPAAESVRSRENVAKYQTELLRRLKPFVAVGPDLSGEYGNGAQILCASALSDALELAADSKCPFGLDDYGIWDTPKAYLHLYPENEIVLDFDAPLERFGGAAAYKKALDGFAKHVTQKAHFPLMQNEAPENFRSFGLFRTTVGPDELGGDLFENIVFERITEPEPEQSPIPLPTAVTSADPPEQKGDDISNNATRPPLFYALCVLCAVAVILVFSFLIRSSRRKK